MRKKKKKQKARKRRRKKKKKKKTAAQIVKYKTIYYHIPGPQYTNKKGQTIFAAIKLDRYKGNV